VTLRLFYGHTDGLIVPFVNYNGKTLVYAADFIPASTHVAMSYVCAYDVNPLISFDEKEEFLEEALTNNYTLFFEHDLYTECCNLERSPRGIKIKERFTLSEFAS